MLMPASLSLALSMHRAQFIDSVPQSHLRHSVLAGSLGLSPPGSLKFSLDTNPTVSKPPVLIETTIP